MFVGNVDTQMTMPGQGCRDGYLLDGQFDAVGKGRGGFLISYVVLFAEGALALGSSPGVVEQ